MPTGYCTVDDVSRVLQEDLTGPLAESSNEVVVDAITAQTEPLEKSLKRHWYVNTRPDEDSHQLLPTSTKSRDDEEDIPTGGAHLVGEPMAPKLWHGSYTRLRLDRRDAESISELLVRTPDGYVDWVADSNYTGGTWPSALGEDYYLRVNNGGWSELYLDTENLKNEDDEWILDTWSNAVYVTFSYGHEGLPKTVRRAVALRAAAHLVTDDELDVSFPDNGQLVNVETKSEQWRSEADELLEGYR